MSAINAFLSCENCRLDFTRDNFAVTLPCGHNYCQECTRKFNKKNYKCVIDNIRQTFTVNPSIEFMNLIDNVKKFPEIFQSSHPVKSFAPPKNLKQGSQKVCKFFLKGKCKYGAKCWNKHIL